MPTVISEFIKPILSIVSPENLVDYYNDSELLESRMKEYASYRFGEKYADAISLDNIDWHNDLVKSINKWTQGKPKDYASIDKWCSLHEYASLQGGSYDRQYPEVKTNPDDPFEPNVFSTPTIEIAPFWKVVRRGDAYNIQIIYDTTDQLESVLVNFNYAMARLFLSHLFFNVHAGYDKLAGYKVEIFKCNSPRCPEPNNMFLVANRHGRKPTYCSNRCRTYVNVTNSRKAKKESRIKAV